MQRTRRADLVRMSWRHSCLLVIRAGSLIPTVRRLVRPSTAMSSVLSLTADPRHAFGIFSPQHGVITSSIFRHRARRGLCRVATIQPPNNSMERTAAIAVSSTPKVFGAAVAHLSRSASPEGAVLCVSAAVTAWALVGCSGVIPQRIVQFIAHHPAFAAAVVA